MRDEHEKAAELIGRILGPPGPAGGGAEAEAAADAAREEPFEIGQIISPQGAEEAPAAEPLAEPEPYTGPERRAPQVIIAELVEDVPPEPRFPPLER